MTFKDDLPDKIYDYVNEMILQCREDEEKFMFYHIGRYLQDSYKTVIPKELLNRALIAFQHEHREEWDYLMAKAEKENADE